VNPGMFMLFSSFAVYLSVGFEPWICSSGIARGALPTALGEGVKIDLDAESASPVVNGSPPHAYHQAPFDFARTGREWRRCSRNSSADFGAVNLKTGCKTDWKTARTKLTTSTDALPAHIRWPECDIVKLGEAYGPPAFPNCSGATTFSNRSDVTPTGAIKRSIRAKSRHIHGVHFTSL
jgi:hypothetical protein